MKTGGTITGCFGMAKVYSYVPNWIDGICGSYIGTLIGCCYLENTLHCTQGNYAVSPADKDLAVPLEAVSSGEVAYKLNTRNDRAWGQLIDTEPKNALPVPNNGTNTVYAGEKYHNHLNGEDPLTCRLCEYPATVPQQVGDVYQTGTLSELYGFAKISSSGINTVISPLPLPFRLHLPAHCTIDSRGARARYILEKSRSTPASMQEVDTRRQGRAFLQKFGKQLLFPDHDASPSVFLHFLHQKHLQIIPQGMLFFSDVLREVQVFPPNWRNEHNTYRSSLLLMVHNVVDKKYPYQINSAYLIIAAIAQCAAYFAFAHGSITFSRKILSANPPRFSAFSALTRSNSSTEYPRASAIAYSTSSTSAISSMLLSA